MTTSSTSTVSLSTLPTQKQLIHTFLSNLTHQKHTPLHNLENTHNPNTDSSTSPHSIQLNNIYELNVLVRYLMRHVNFLAFEEETPPVERIVQQVFGDEQEITQKNIRFPRDVVAAVIETMWSNQFYRVFREQYLEDIVALSECESIRDFDWHLNKVAKSQTGHDQLLCKLTLFLNDNDETREFEMDEAQLGRVLQRFEEIEAQVQQWSKGK